MNKIDQLRIAYTLRFCALRAKRAGCRYHEAGVMIRDIIRAQQLPMTNREITTSIKEAYGRA
jgi:hypothetical protein